MSNRVRGARRAQGAIMCAAALACTPWVGWWLVPLFFVVAAMLAILERAMPGARRPELYSLAALSVFAVVVAILVLGSGGVASPFSGWFLVPLIMLAARFRPQVVYTGLAATWLLAAGAFLGAEDLPRPARLPVACSLVVWAGMVLGVLAGVMALLRAELTSRGHAMVDPLTGLYNRAALLGRFGQAAEQASVVSGWLSVIMLDIDHFKAINDTYGHDVGDAVLRGMGEQLRAAPHLSDVVYRYGGEEFLLLLPGYDVAAAEVVAEQLRNRVAGHSYAGVNVTISAGVAGGRGHGLVFATLLRAADRALYAAKESGRDRICVAA